MVMTINIILFEVSGSLLIELRWINIVILRFFVGYLINLLILVLLLTYYNISRKRNHIIFSTS